MDSGAFIRLNELEAVIGYRFGNRLLLEEALTHRSFLNEAGVAPVRDNERLEFFGDAILDFLISSMLLERFPDCREGELTRIRSSLVAEESLAHQARQIGLGSFLRLGRGEEKNSGRTKRSILADAYEALLAAVYLDGGIEVVRRLVAGHFEPSLADSAVAPAGRDYKTELQELSQALRGKTPRYSLKEASGPDHERTFVVMCWIGEECLGEGSGRSKKEAEQQAAKNGLAHLAPASGIP